MAGRFEGKTAIITGAARGQGLVEALLFAAEGARVFLTDVGECEEELPDGCKFLKHDVTSEEDWVRVIETVMADSGRLDILVNNAGVFKRGSLSIGSKTETTVPDFDFVMAVNVKGTFLGMKHASHAMRSLQTPEEDRAIVNISSVAGLNGTPGAVAYGASKWAVRGMTKGAATELGRYGIRVNSVHPGQIGTKMLFDQDENGVGIIEGSESKGVPLGKRVGDAEEVAQLVLFLCSEAASYISGGEYTVDGAMSASL